MYSVNSVIPDGQHTRTWAGRLMFSVFAMYNIQRHMPIAICILPNSRIICNLTRKYSYIVYKSKWLSNYRFRVAVVITSRGCISCKTSVNPMSITLNIREL